MHADDDKDRPSEPLWTLEDLRMIRRRVDRFLEQYADPSTVEGAEHSSSSGETSTGAEEDRRGRRDDVRREPEAES